ncbi:ADP-ribose pyrophosphatase [Paenibacillus sp. BIHB 4019]|uniref:ADP-ribose pyrophosphatase n=1 Tax=Paenibacillus sp. BIHB 4019 TaxID=1870819 RepID=A0A1B2DDR5_9BACL|nr:NUDIX hydrolase [Paenibacillus sp. BIHB 4019]ANY65854.1 ADP-ribose pyrophosphatase [Paenibacillus sp. BIHB 4019]
MNHSSDEQWLDWVKRIQALAQNGLAYSENAFDIERYEELRAISVDMLAYATGIGREQLKHTFASDKGYATPKVGIRGVVFQDGKILMVKEQQDQAWALPGGWADVGISPSEVAVKEIWEESGFKVKPKRLLAVLDKKKHEHPPDIYHIYDLFIECEIIGGEAAVGPETTDVGFFAEDGLPPLSVQRNTERQIKMMFEFLKQPDKPVVLD